MTNHEYADAHNFKSLHQWLANFRRQYRMGQLSIRSAEFANMDHPVGRAVLKSFD